MKSGHAWHMLAAVAVLASCSTDDVSVEADADTSTQSDTTDTNVTDTLVGIPDDAFGEYLSYLSVPGVVENDAGAATRFSLDPDLVKSVTELPLSKTTSAVTELTNAGLTTADQKITNLEGLQYFVGLETLTLTSNAVTSLDVTKLTKLKDLEMNFNLVGSLDLSKNPALEVLRYGASSSANESQRLKSIDLSANTALRHLYLKGHDLTAIDLSNNPNIDEVLDLSDNPGPDGDRSTPDIPVPDAIYDAVPEATRLGVTKASGAPVQVSLSVDPSAVAEAGGVATITARLNRAADEVVTLDLAVSGTATSGDDYTLAATSLSIPAGEMTATTTLTAVDDSTEEGAETVVVTETNVAGAQAGVSEVTVTITDDDGTIDIIINEVLYDPPDGADGDANGDGTRDPNQDEFVEIVNVGSTEADLGGLELYDTEALDAGTPRHVIPAGTTLAPGKALVVFGGGTPTGSFGGATVQTANGFENQLNLNNSGDVLTVKRAGGAVIVAFDVEPLSNNPNESYTRDPDLTGDFVQHHTAQDGVLFSPGTRVDGTAF